MWVKFNDDVFARVENKKKKEEKSSYEDESRKKPRPAPKSTASAPRVDTTNYKHMTGSSQYRFGVLAKIVRHLKTLHQDGGDHALTLEEILDETNQLNVGTKIIQWLRLEALINNPKIEATPDGRFMFKPPYRIRDKKGLLKLLKQTDLKCHGGIFLDDIQESLPNYEKILKAIDKDIWTVTRPLDKKKLLFYDDKSSHFNVDEEFNNRWRGVAVDGIDDNKIEEYLIQQGIRSMEGSSVKVLPKHLKRKAGAKKRTFKKPRDNEHLKDILEDYDQ